MNAPDFNPAHIAVLQQELASGISPPDSSSLVRVADYASRSITVEAEVSKPALLVLSEVYYPPGWAATIDGQETPIYRTNSVLRSVVVPPGRHSVLFRYDPALYHLGYGITIGAWIVAALLVVAPLALQQRARKRAASTAAAG